MKLYVKRKISAAHFLPRHKGKCAKTHGHTWTIEVWLEGKLDLKEGMLIDFGVVKNTIDRYDHSMLNDLMRKDPTAENLAVLFVLAIPHAMRVRVWESEDCYAEVDLEEALGFGDEHAYDRHRG